MSTELSPSSERGPFPSLDDFRPLPLLSNPHLQTLVGFFFLSTRFPYPTTQRVLTLPDGDALVLHDSVPRDWHPGRRMALLVHGLTGSHRTPLIVRLAAQLLAEGVRVVRMDMRGTGAGLALARRFYHAGRSDDVRAVLAEMHHWSPDSPLLVLGTSLGGNLALKMAGELPEHPVPGLARIVALGPPIDLGRCCAKLSRAGNRLYERNFVSLLITEAKARARCFPDQPSPRFPRRMTLRLFDDLYTAPRCGFADALDYYRRASSAPLLGRIPVPTLILTARDDPFIAVEPFEELRLPDAVTLVILRHGGHLGFVGWDGAGGVRWVDRRTVAWLLQ
jgi:predicted alpha/beta-fold hydrolase